MTFRLYPGVPDDFEARIRILAPEEGGRRSPARNGIRWDFAYADDAGAPELFMIWPDFRHAEGDSCATELPVGEPLLAGLTVVNEVLRAGLHRERIRPGVRFHCHEGPRVVAVGSSHGSPACCWIAPCFVEVGSDPDRPDSRRAGAKGMVRCLVPISPFATAGGPAYRHPVGCAITGPAPDNGRIHLWRAASTKSSRSAISATTRT